MLTELEELQSSDEQLWKTHLSFEIETRSEEGNEIVHKTYTFNYADAWEKWTFSEYLEKRTPDTARMGDRDWRKARHIYWQDHETPSIEVPPEVSQRLAEMVGADSVTVQVPAGSINEHSYKKFTYERE